MFRSVPPKRLAMYALRGFILYFFFALILHMTTGLLYVDGVRLPGMGVLSHADVSADLGLDFDVTPLYTLLIIPFLYYSIARAFALGDAYGYAAFCETDDGRMIGLRDVFSSPVYLITLATTALGYAVFPLSFGFSHLQAWLDFASVLGAVTEKILFAIPLLIVFPVLLALAHSSARREWQRIRKERQTPDPRAGYGGLIGFLKDKTGAGGLISTTFMLLWLYPLGAFAGSILLLILLPFILTMFRKPIYFLIGLAIIVGVVLIVTLPSYLRAFSKRRKLMRGLKKVCRRCGYELTVTGHPYLGLLHYHGHADFSVKVGEKQYDCKLLSSVLPGGKMVFGYDGRVAIHHYIRFFWAARAMHMATAHTFEQSTFQTEMEYAFESDHQKVLIVAPVAAQTFIVSSHGGTPIDTGAHIGDYRMFNTTGFLGALERDCLDR